ncbi:carbohydrate ABC transporter permease [Streptomyces sp. ISL-100]|uniref:carbohydrate ABC transporter permease n=1 Tax=Streptomyces sp. ISL-100 TaxID=2819173 RepID=UPI001BEB3200|nr:carbohydrate ABC transporter permease [Streptomyces sp. ISL-100]MBT2395381.1 carbohydrate ABC transporter permease [Streptomyces sp. ISL-100]
MTVLEQAVRTPTAPVASDVRDHRRRRLWRLLAGTLMALYGIVSVYPFLWMVSGAFKDEREVIASGSLIPEHPTLGTLRDTFVLLNVGDYVLNSLVVTVGSLLLILVIYPLAGYAFSVLRFPGRRALYAMFIAIFFVPGVTTLLPLILTMDQLGLLGTHLGLQLAFANGSAPLAIMLFKTYYDTIPRELRDSARMDGCGEVALHFRIYLPLAKPAIATVAVINFVAIWNEYIVSGVSLSDPSTFTLPLGLQRLLSQNVVEWNQVMAASLLVVIPVIVVFVVLRRFFVSGIQGAVKM